jgi:twitching motility two-component system response regulator PilH
MARVLVIDDDRALTLAIRIRLQAAGFEVVVAHDSRTGSQLAIREKPDVILLDVDMPHFSGSELHECLKYAERARHIPVVYLSGNDSISTRAAAFRSGARAFIGKPYDSVRLIQTLRKAIAPAQVSAAAQSDI